MLRAWGREFEFSGLILQGLGVYGYVMVEVVEAKG